jgi:hypothetical protein
MIWIKARHSTSNITWKFLKSFRSFSNDSLCDKLCVIGGGKMAEGDRTYQFYFCF